MKDNLVHIAGIRSSRTLFPGFGALGLIRAAAEEFRVVQQAAAAAPAVESTAKPTEYKRTREEKSNFTGGRRYSSPHS